jgi:hypothetical protein
MRDITTIQEALVAAHIDALRSEASAFRAKRERDHVQQHTAAGADVDDHSADRPPRRVRIGRWLVAVGEAVAGSTRSVSATPRSMAAASAGTDDPCGDGHDRMVPAA